VPKRGRSTTEMGGGAVPLRSPRGHAPSQHLEAGIPPTHPPPSHTRSHTHLRVHVTRQGSCNSFCGRRTPQQNDVGRGQCCHVGGHGDDLVGSHPSHSRRRAVTHTQAHAYIHTRTHTRVHGTNVTTQTGGAPQPQPRNSAAEEQRTRLTPPAYRNNGPRASSIRGASTDRSSARWSFVAAG